VAFRPVRPVPLGVSCALDAGACRLLGPLDMPPDSSQPGRPAASLAAECPEWAIDDPELAALCQEFVMQLPQRAEAMECLLAKGDLQGLLVEAHQLKGTAGTYGFPWISEAAAALELIVQARAALDAVRLQVREVASLCRHAGHRR